MQTRNTFVQILQRMLYYYPLTLTGSILFVFALLLLYDALLSLNPFSFILSIFALTVLFVLGILNRIQVLHPQEMTYEWDSAEALYAGKEYHQRIYCEGFRILPFFRLHFLLSGRLFVAEKESFLFIREFSSPEPERFEFPLYFPLCGSLKTSGFLCVKDIFGLTRARFTPAIPRTLTIRPPVILHEEQAPAVTMDGMEDTARKKDTNEERYYQREYMAGDKLRDINWKVSGRLSTLITKVSHITQEKTRLLTIFFQNYRKPGPESLDSIVHLNVVKGWMLSFIKVMKEAYPDYNFEVITNQDKFTIETPDDIDHLGLVLGTIHYHSLVNNTYIPHPGEVFIFTTPFDTQLSRLISGLDQSRIHLFRSIHSTPSAHSAKKQKQATFSLLKPLPHFSFPGLWVLRREKELYQHRLPNVNSINIEEILVDAKLL
jgi:hypothetical protein